MNKWAGLVLFIPAVTHAALISRVYTFSDGNVLFADQLNTELNNVVNGVNSINNDNLATNANISASKISAAIAGNGLTRNGTTGVLSVVPDNSTIEISANALQVKDAGITAAKLAADVKSVSLPSGSILTFAGPTCPTGYIVANGAAVSRTVTYADLFAAIGTAHGSGDGSTTFNLPDYRGRFLRGIDAGEGRDPDVITRTAMNPGGNLSDNVGSVQGYATARPIASSFSTGAGGSHTHTGRMIITGGSPSVTVGGSASTAGPTGYASAALGIPLLDIQTTGSSHSHSITAGGDAETRPMNAYVNYCVKL